MLGVLKVLAQNATIVIGISAVVVMAIGLNNGVILYTYNKEIKMNESIKDDLSFVKNELESLNIKVDMILDMLNSFTMMIADDDESDDIYDTEDSWATDQSDEWNSYEDEDDE